MKYTVGGTPLATKNGTVMPGATVEASDFPPGTLIQALVAAGHLTEVPEAKPAAKKVER